MDEKNECEEDMDEMIAMSEEMGDVFLNRENPKIAVVLGACEMVVASVIKNCAKDETQFLEMCDSFHERIKLFGRIIDLQKEKEGYDNKMERR